MNIIQLTYFKYVVDELSVTKAASRLFVTQSAVSQQIHLLEDDLGCQLFYRKGRQFRITSEGEFIYQKAKSIISQFDGLRDELKSQGKNVVGKVKIGSGPVVSKEFLPDIICQTLKVYPKVSFSLFEIHSYNLIQSIMESRIDLGLGQINDEDKRICSEKLLTGRLVLICSSRSNWNSRKSVSLRDLSKMNLIHRVKEVENNFLSDILQKNNTGKSFRLEAMNTETIVPYVKRGLGMALAPDYIIRLMAPKGISIIELKEKKYLSWGVMWDKSIPLTKAAQVVIENLKQKLKSHPIGNFP